MTDKITLFLSWILLALFVPTYFWNMDAGLVVGGIAAMIRWEDIKKAETAIKANKDKFWVSYWLYVLSLAAIFLVLKLNGTQPKDYSTSQGRIILAAVFLPLLPRLIRHEYKYFIQVSGRNPCK